MPNRIGPPSLEDYSTDLYRQREREVNRLRRALNATVLGSTTGRADRVAVIQYGEASVLLIAEQMKANLIENGWIEPPKGDLMRDTTVNELGHEREYNNNRDYPSDRATR